MKRRDVLILAGSLPLGVNAQVSDLADAINKAGRQRMLSQRMGKAWLAMVHKTEDRSAQAVLDKSMALFDRQLAELKAFSPSPEIRETYTALEGAWSDYKGTLVGAAPTRATSRRPSATACCRTSCSRRSPPTATGSTWPSRSRRTPTSPRSR